MSKRNFILLIIILVIAVVSVFAFLYLRGNTSTNGGDNSIGTNFLSIFNPFRNNNTDNAGDSTTGDGVGVDTNGDGVITNQELSNAKLKKVSSMPIAGFGIFAKERLKDVPIPIPPATTETESATKKSTTKPIAPPTEFAQAVRYVDRTTGNIYQTFADKIEERKFSQTIIPKIYDAYFGNNGMSVVMRHLKADSRTIETVSAALPKEILGEDKDSNDIIGSLLSDNIKDISVSADNSKIFYLFNTLGFAVGTTMGLSDGKKTQVFDSAFTEWNSYWPNNNTITLTTKPSGKALGFMYGIDLAKKSFTRILGNIEGLTTLTSSSGKLILVANKDLSLYVYNTDTQIYSEIAVRTLPEKCVWSKTNDYIYCAVPVNFDTNFTYPDDWYRGEISFSDQIWKINLIDGSTSMIADPILVEGGEDIDGTKLALDANEDYLFFVNKKNSYLWELGLR